MNSLSPIHPAFVAENNGFSKTVKKKKSIVDHVIFKSLHPRWKLSSAA